MGKQPPKSNSVKPAPYLPAHIVRENRNSRQSNGSMSGVEETASQTNTSTRDKQPTTSANSNRVKKTNSLPSIDHLVRFLRKGKNDKGYEIHIYECLITDCGNVSKILKYSYFHNYYILFPEL